MGLDEESRRDIVKYRIERAFINEVTSLAKQKLELE